MAVVDGDILRFTAQLTGTRGETIQNVFTYKYTGAGDTDDEVGDEIKADVDAGYADIDTHMDAQVDSEQVTMWRWDAVLDQWDGIYQEAWGSITGLAVGEALPSGAALLIKLLTALPRRQGRKFCGGMSANQYTDTGWAAAVLAAAALASADWLGTVITANGSCAPGVFNEVTESFIPFKASAVVNAYTNYQRRRRPGVGI